MLSIHPRKWSSYDNLPTHEKCLKRPLSHSVGIPDQQWLNFVVVWSQQDKGGRKSWVVEDQADRKEQLEGHHQDSLDAGKTKHIQRCKPDYGSLKPTHQLSIFAAVVTQVCTTM